MPKIYGRVSDSLVYKNAVQHIELDDVVYCFAHFNGKFPTLWNYTYVNYPSLQDALKSRFVYWTDGDEVLHCDMCKAQLHIPNSDAENWTQAWTEVGIIIGFAVAERSIYPNETELRHQCYIILGRYHIKAADYKRHVRVLIELAKEISRQKGQAES